MKRILFPLFLIIIGAFVAIGPTHIFPVCEATIATVAGRQVPMKCFWTAQAELGAGAVLLLGGVLLLLSKSSMFKCGVASMCALVCILIVSIPTLLIGVCPGETMPCHLSTQPALLVSGLIGLLASLVLVIANRMGWHD